MAEGSSVQHEAQRRDRMWTRLMELGGNTNVEPQILRDLRIYGGAQGIWVDKAQTAGASPDGAGVVVGCLHNGSSYADDLTDDGVIYHYPKTGRPAGRDASEIASLRNAAILALPVFVITSARSSSARRSVYKGWVTGVDDAAEQCLILFGDRRPGSVTPATSEFRLEANREELRRTSARLKRDARFAFMVGQLVGWKCAFCGLGVRQLLDAAHVRGVADKGSDDPRNGMILCKNHHAAFDAGLVLVDPDSFEIKGAPGVDSSELGLRFRSIPDEHRPHPEALRWRSAFYARRSSASLAA